MLQQVSHAQSGLNQEWMLVKLEQLGVTLTTMSRLVDHFQSSDR